MRDQLNVTASKRMAVQPGMTEDKRYVLFGLAEKTVFTQGEIEQLRKDYPEFDSEFWPAWKDYVKLLKEDVFSLTQAKLAAENRIDELNGRKFELEARKSKYDSAITESVAAKTAVGEALVYEFNDRKAQFLEEVDGIISEITVLQSTVNALDSKLSDIATNKESLLLYLNSKLKEWGGKLPTEV